MSAREVDEFDDDLRQLATRMQALMEDANGVGLAANQVGVLRRVVVFRMEEGEEPVAAVNPRVVQHELDHLDGVLILDRTTPEARREAMAILRPQPVLG